MSLGVMASESRVFIASVSSEEDILQSLLSTEQAPGSSYHTCRAPQFTFAQVPFILLGLSPLTAANLALS